MLQSWLNTQSHITKSYLKYKISEISKLIISLAKFSKKLLTDLNELSTTLLAMGQTFSQLYKISSDFNNSINCGKNRALDEIYVTMNNSFMNLGNIFFLFKIKIFIIGENIYNEIKVVSDNICNFFRYEKKFNESIKEVII